MPSFFSRPYLIYLLKFGLSFCILYWGTLLIIGLSSEENSYSPFVARYLDFITPLRVSILWCADSLLRLFRFATTWTDPFTVGIQGGRSVRMVYSCVGYGVMSFWAAFIFANPGRFFKKLKWLAGGWILLWVLNVLRVFFLVIAINQASANKFVIDHHTVFNVVVYAFIFLLIYLYNRDKNLLPSKASFYEN